MALGVDAAGHGQTDEIHLCGSGEHEGSNFDGTDSAFKVEFGSKRDAGELIARDVRQEGAGVYIDGVATGGLDDRNSAGGDVIAEISGGGDAVVEVFLLEGFLNSDGNGFEVAAGKTAVGWVALGEDEEIFFLLGEDVVVGAEEATDVGHAVFFGGHGAAVAVAEHLLCYFFRSFVGVAGLAEFDEPGVLGEAAGVEVERDVVALADGADRADVLHGNGLAASGVVRDGEHDERDVFAAYASDERFERGDIHVAFEGIAERGLAAFRNEEVDGFCADELDVGARGVEMGVVGDDVALLTGNTEEDALGGAALVGGDDVGVADDVLDGVAESVEAAAAGVALVAFHDGCPLMRGHGAGAGVGEEVDEDVVGVEKEEVVMCGFEELFALGAGGPADGLDALDAEGLDDGFDGHDTPS